MSLSSSMDDEEEEEEEPDLNLGDGLLSKSQPEKDSDALAPG